MNKKNRPPIKIERARPVDAEAICDIRDRARIKAYPNPALGITAEDIEINCKGKNGEFVPRRIANLKERLTKGDNNGLTVFVAKVGGQVVGYVDPVIDEDGRQCIRDIYVAPEMQSKGIGEQLLRRALETLDNKKPIFLEVVSYNQNAINFYKKFGFEETNTFVPEEEGRPSYMKSIPQIEMVLKAQT